MALKMDISENQLRKLYIGQKLSIRQCASQLNCSHTLLVGRLRDFNIPVRNAKHKEIISKEWLVNNYVVNGRTIEECSKLIGVSRGEIHLSLSEYQIIRRKQAHLITKSLDKDLLIELYLNRGLSLEECGRELNVTHHTVSFYIKKYKILQRSRSDAIMAERNPRWNNGSSFLPYCPKFNNELREEIREAFGRKCYICGTPEHGRRLAVHHINFDKKAGCYGRKFNLIPLCAKCHGKMGGSRHYYFNRLANWWALNPETTFQSVM